MREGGRREEGREGEERVREGGWHTWFSSCRTSVFPFISGCRHGSVRLDPMWKISLHSPSSYAATVRDRIQEQERRKQGDTCRERERQLQQK